MINIYKGKSELELDEKYSPIAQRFKSIYRLKCRYNFIDDNMTISALGIHIRELEYIFAFVFLGKNGKPLYYSLSPCYQSEDGEYRKSFTYFSKLNSSEMTNLLVDKNVSKLGQVIVDDLTSKNITFYTTFNFENQEDTFFKLFLLFILTAIRYEKNYKYFNYNEQTKKLISKIISKYKDNVIDSKTDLLYKETLLAFTIFIREGEFNIPLSLIPGQKLRPLTNYEIANTSDIQYYVWSEIYIQKITNDLIFNLISFNFPAMIRWTIIKNTSAGTYTNKSIVNKYNISDKVDIILDAMRLGRKSLSAEKKEKFQIKLFDAKLYETIVDAKKYLSLSQLSTLVLSENVGTPIATLYEIVNSDKSTEKSFHGTIQLSKNVFFECIYAVKCLQERGGIIHADLHANNIALNPYELFEFDLPDKPTDYLKAFIIGKETYTMEYTLTPYIIDFSRSILMPSLASRLDADFRKSYSKLFFRNQAHKVLRLLYRFYPKYVEANQEHIKGLIFSFPEQMYTILSYADYIMVCLSWKYCAKLVQNEELIAFISKVEAYIRGRFEAAIREITEAKEKIPTFGFISADIMAEFFSDFKGPKKGQTFMSIAIFDSKIEYTLRHKDKHPPWLDELKPSLPECATEVFGWEPNVLDVQLEETEKDKDEPAEVATSSWV